VNLGKSVPSYSSKEIAMGLWDSVSNVLSGGGKHDASQGYDQANQYLDPYRKGGAEDYSNYRNYSQRQGQNLAPYENAGSYQYSQINQSPTDYYNHIMQGYGESPQAKYEQEQAMRAANAGGSASGMIGSGAYTKAVQQNAADISARDQQRYFGNVQGANQMQMGYLNNLNNRQDQYSAMQQYLTGLGYNGASGMGENSINRGLSNAKYDQSAFDSIMGLTAAGGQNYKNNAAFNAGGGAAGGAGGAGGGGAAGAAQQIPWYMMMM
jgi:hypothetical protein